ncbi:hypothetical protein Q0M94_17895 (plasmid) [Deinococcus radiomollis]|uniref:hypothetical protein n=1 Tax=Deinococcus radiomollis TaxID=468916 RepID=UPI0038920360
MFRGLFLPLALMLYLRPAWLFAAACMCALMVLLTGSAGERRKVTLLFVLGAGLTLMAGQ